MIAIMQNGANNPASAKLEDLFAECADERVDGGALVFSREQPVSSAIWLSSGRVRLTRVNRDGDLTVLHTAEGPAWLAEASCFAARYHCDAEALTDAVIRRAPLDRFLQSMSRQPEIARTALATLSRDLRDARARAEILAMKTVAERLQSWLDVFGGKPEATPWSAVAEEIGVTAPALYRELARRREAGAPE